MASFIRKVPTASGARAVQIVHKQGRQVLWIEHIGSAHDDGQLAVLMEIARQRLLPGQDSFGLGPSNAPTSASVSASSGAGAGARIIEPTSKADTIRVLGEIGVAAPGLRTMAFLRTGRVHRCGRDIDVAVGRQRGPRRPHRPVQQRVGPKAQGMARQRLVRAETSLPDNTILVRLLFDGYEYASAFDPAKLIADATLNFTEFGCYGLPLWGAVGARSLESVLGGVSRRCLQSASMAS